MTNSNELSGLPAGRLVRSKGSMVEISVLESPEGDVVARGTYYGGPAYEFVVIGKGPVYFRVVGDADIVWAGPDAESFRRIAAAWNRCRNELPLDATETAQLERIGQMRRELEQLGAFPTDLPEEPEPLWSLLVFEAENGLG